MAFAINQNFDLKSKRKDFVRQELTLEQLKTTRDADYPDDYQVVIGGKIYIFNSANPVDPILGKWKEFKSGAEVKAGAGLAMDAGGTMSVKVPSVGAIQISPRGEIDVNRGQGLCIDESGYLAVDCGDGLVYDPGLESVVVQPDEGIKVSIDGVAVKTGKGLKIDEAKAVAINIGSNLKFDPAGALCVDVPSLIAGTGVVTEGGSVGVQVGSGLQTNKDNQLEVKISDASGLKFSDTGELQINVGSGLIINPIRGCIMLESAEKPVLSVGTGLTLQPSDGGNGENSKICITPIQQQQLYYDDGSNAVVPFKHPDISTQPTILPYKFFGNYVYEQWIRLGTQLGVAGRILPEHENLIILECSGVMYGKAPDYGIKCMSTLAIGTRKVGSVYGRADDFRICTSLLYPLRETEGGWCDQDAITYTNNAIRVVYTTMPDDLYYDSNDGHMYNNKG